VSRVAIRYSKALFELAEEEKLVERVQEDLVSIDRLCRENAGFDAMLVNPLIDEPAKAKILSELFEHNVHEMTYRFLQLLSKKRRIGFLREIIGHYNDRVLDYQGIVPAVLLSADALSREAVGQIKERIERITGKKVQLSEKQNTEILGGFIIRIRDTIIDLSIKTQLDRLRTQLIQG
jgi:F-type H+-transporting ATPase subunit delta